MKNLGSSLSLLIAMGDRDAASIPPLAVVTKAAIAAKARIIKPARPVNLLAANDMGQGLVQGSVAIKFYESAYQEISFGGTTANIMITGSYGNPDYCIEIIDLVWVSILPLPLLVESILMVKKSCTKKNKVIYHGRKREIPYRIM